jgi:hypothetical protein
LLNVLKHVATVTLVFKKMTRQRISPFYPFVWGRHVALFKQFLTTLSFATNLLAMGKRKQRHNPKHGNWVLSFVGALNPEKQTKI